MSYLGTLTLRLAAGAMRLTEPLRARHGDYLAGLQNADGGFSGRQGPSDLYYTGFALRGLALLGRLDDSIAGPAAAFLQQQLGRSLPSIDFLSLVFSAVLLEFNSGVDVFSAAGKDRVATVLATVGPLRRADGGYARSDRSGPSSTYQTFLIASCLQLVGVPLERPGHMIDLARSRQRDDGGFVELDPMRESGVNPTAAAVGLLRLLDGLDPATSQRARAFLAGMQNQEGGLRANTKIPIADLLSTFTGLVALADLGGLDNLDLPAAQRYAAGLARTQGGFCGATWDQTADVEYTLYGLGTLALLAPVVG